MKNIVKILMIVFEVLTFVFAALELMNIFSSNYYTLTLGLVCLCQAFVSKDDDNKFSLISLIIGILIVISFIISII